MTFKVWSFSFCLEHIKRDFHHLQGHLNRTTMSNKQDGISILTKTKTFSLLFSIFASWRIVKFVGHNKIMEMRLKIERKVLQKEKFRWKFEKFWTDYFYFENRSYFETSKKCGKSMKSIYSIKHWWNCRNWAIKKLLKLQIYVI